MSILRYHPQETIVYLCTCFTSELRLSIIPCNLDSTRCQPLYRRYMALMLEEIGLDLAIAGIWATLDIP